MLLGHKHVPIVVALLLQMLSSLSQAAIYDVGPGQALATPEDVAWESLGPGDEVNIHWREQPYRNKWVLCVRGSENAPIVVRGIPGPNGQRPVISGENATTRQALNFTNEVRGVIKIGSANVPSDLLPAYIVIEGLEVRTARPGYSFTDFRNNTQEYVNNAAAIYVEKAEHLRIQNCELHDAGNGLFIGVYDGQTQNILIDGNYIHGNGIEGRFYEHNSYTSAIGITFQHNHYGPLREGCGGNNLKDRSAGLVVRYNWLEGGNRQLDLVDGEDSPNVVNHPSYRQTFVYGNVLIEPDLDGNSQMVHYGGDSGTLADYRKGTLFFYNNTVVSNRITSGSDNTTLFRLSTNDERADVRNNIFFTTASSGHLALLSEHGVIDLSHNWLRSGYRPSHDGSYDGTINDNGGNISGTTVGFVDENGQNFELAESNEVEDLGTTLHATALPDNDVLEQYQRHLLFTARPLDQPFDMGAFERVGDGSDAGNGSDAGQNDATHDDARQVDVAQVDAAQLDASHMDAAQTDTAVGDAGTVDSQADSQTNDDARGFDAQGTDQGAHIDIARADVGESADSTTAGEAVAPPGCACASATASQHGAVFCVLAMLWVLRRRNAGPRERP